MEVIGHGCSALCVLLQLSICCNAQTFTKHEDSQVALHSSCENSPRFISPNNFQYLQENICSNKIIIIDSGTFNVNNRRVIMIENVSNLTISGQESRSVIQCHQPFGFHLKNTTNVTFTQLTIRDCAIASSDIKYRHVWPFTVVSQPDYTNKTTFLIEDTKNLYLLGINIQYSPGVALILIGNDAQKKSEEHLFLGENVKLVNSTISSSRNGSIAVYGALSLLIERTVIANATNGIISFHANLMMVNVEIFNCTSSALIYGHGIVSKTLTMKRSSLYSYRHTLSIRDSSVNFLGDYSERGLHVYDGNIFIEEDSLVIFAKFYHTTSFSYALYTRNSKMVLNNSSLNFTQNLLNRGASIFAFINTTFQMIKKSSLIFTNNFAQGPLTAGLWLEHSWWYMTFDSNIIVKENNASNGFLMAFLGTRVSFNGSVAILKNTVRDFGVLNIIVSEVSFHGTVEVRKNRAESGAISADSSGVNFTNTSIFSENVAENGGAMTMSCSRMSVSPYAAISFTGNQAKGLGGAIYISKIRIFAAFCMNSQARATFCSIQVIQEDSNKTCNFSNFTFNENKAGIAGNAIYGGLSSACIPCIFEEDDNCMILPVPNIRDLFHYNTTNDSSDLSSFTSDPTRVCFCENGIPDCYKFLKNITVYPGEYFNLSLAIVGYGLGTVPGSVIARGSTAEQNLLGSKSEYSQEIMGTKCEYVNYSVVSQSEKEQIALAVYTTSFVISLEEVLNIVEFQRTGHLNYTLSHYDSIYEHFFHIPVYVDTTLLPCPVGFQLLRGRCICHQILLENNINTCLISNGAVFIMRPAPYWIGLPNDKNLSILIHPHCPFDYCQAQDINITTNSTNIQCQYRRSGILCGSCHKGFSIILGSSECRTCSNINLVSIMIFIVLGVSLVTLLTLLNMTVSVGTLNGLILVANILQANQATFLPPKVSHTHYIIQFLSAFIAWLNLDLGIPLCFYNGLTTYVKTWLQFLFPLYILTLVGAIIIVSNYSTRMTRLFGSNAVSVLATLVLLSYTKILRILITAFSFTTVTGSQDYHSVVWLADGNITYLELKHVLLFVVSLLVLLLFGIPYTVILVTAPCIQGSRYKWMSAFYNKFKPLFDAYMGPYKDSCRYWTGMLLLARVILIVLFSSIANTNTVAGPQLNLLFLILSSAALLALTAFLKPYRRKFLNGLDIFSLTILFLLSSSIFYVSHISTGVGSHASIYIVFAGMFFIVFLGIFAGHIWYKIKKVYLERKLGISGTAQEPHRPLLWQRGKVTVETGDEEKKGALSTTGASNTASDGEKTDYRDSVLDLASSN